nr:immunoglobulin heavy chain junction region [Mus musculus]MBK4185103.1 immunoglobulin heavy chain junction region [Mus musculus]
CAVPGVYYYAMDYW